MTKVLMVCLGNICRSPLAEGILKSKVDQHHIFVDSAGTGGWHLGNLPDHRSIDVAKDHQIDITDQRCRKFDVSDFDDFDWILVMDRSNYSDVVHMARNEADIRKVHMIMNFSKAELKEVPDPYYGGSGGFENVYQILDEVCEIIADKLVER